MTTSYPWVSDARSDARSYVPSDRNDTTLTAVFLNTAQNLLRSGRRPPAFGASLLQRSIHHADDTGARFAAPAGCCACHGKAAGTSKPRGQRFGSISTHASTRRLDTCCHFCDRVLHLPHLETASAQSKCLHSSIFEQLIAHDLVTLYQYPNQIIQSRTTITSSRYYKGI